MPAVKRRYPKEAIARRGDEIYERAVKPTLKPEDQGKFAAIDIETGAFEIDADEWTAGKRLRAHLPQSQIWMVRIGSPFVHRLVAFKTQMGGRLSPYSA